MSERSMTQKISDSTATGVSAKNMEEKQVRPVEPEDREHFQEMLKKPSEEENGEVLPKPLLQANILQAASLLKSKENGDAQGMLNHLQNSDSKESKNTKTHLMNPNHIVDPALINIPVSLPASNVAPIQTELAHIPPTYRGADVMQKIVDAVESIALAQNKETGQEMRIVLKEHVLPNTEIRINASNNHLVVQFITASGAANQWLDQRLLNMQAGLERALKRSVDLSLVFNPQHQEGSANQERPYP